MKNYKKIIVLMLMLAVIPVFSACGNSNSEENEAQSEYIELSEEIIEDNKIETVDVIEKPVTTTIKTTGEIKTDEDKFYTVNSMLSGE